MKNKFNLIVTILAISAVCAGKVFSQETENKKLAQTGMKFLSVSTDARISALADASVCYEGGASSMFFNPSGMASQNETFSFALGKTQFIADINYLHGAFSWKPDWNYGNFGVFFTWVNYGVFYRTAPSGESYIDMGEFTPYAGTVGLGYGIMLSEKFQIGANVKYVYQDLSKQFVKKINDSVFSHKIFDNNVLGFDFGLIYRTGFKSLNFGMYIRNFSQEVKYEKESFQLPLTFKMGVGMDLIDLTNINPEQHSLMAMIDASHPRDYPEQISVGLEYTFMQMISLRAGYITPSDEQGINAGFGLKHKLGDVSMSVDYAYSDYGVFNTFNNVHKFSFTFGF